MKFHSTELPGVWLIEMELREDERGFLARSWCEQEFAAHGLKMRVVQCNVSFNRRKGTLRGMHYQKAPHGEAKLIRCTRGAVYDVALDLRATSPTFKQWISVELTPESRQMIFIPEGFAHGLQTLEDNTELLYLMSEFYHPESASGVRWNDPTFGIQWPACETRIISQKDADYPDFHPANGGQSPRR